MKDLLIRLVCIAVLLLSASILLGSSTNLMDVENDERYYPTITQYSPSESFFERLGQELVLNQDAVESGLGLSASMKWAQTFQTSRYDYHENATTRVQKSMFRLFEDSGKEAALATLPVDEMEERGRMMGKFFVSLLTGVFGNTIEERAMEADDVAEVPSLNASEQSYWKKLRDEKRLQYGIRPFRADPRIYAGARFGHWGPMGLPIVILDNRVSFRSFDTVRAKSSVVMPMTRSLYFSASVQADLWSLDPQSEDLWYSVKLEQYFGKQRHHRAFQLGIRTHEEKPMLFANLSANW